MSFYEMLTAYIQDKIDIHTFCRDINRLFHRLLKEHEFLKLEYLKIYPFISALQDEDLYEEHLLKEEVGEILSILTGRKNFSYDMWLGLEENEIIPFHHTWDTYKRTGIISFEESEAIEKELSNSASDIKSIGDLCREKLLTLLAGLPATDGDDTYDLLYVPQISKTHIEDEIERLMDILAGKKPVHILIKYMGVDCIYIIL